MSQVLIVDDEPTPARLLARELREAPERYDVLTALSADEGLTALADHPIDCVVLDYRLPDSRGLNCLRAIRLAQPALPVILYTAGGSSDLAEQARRLGARYVEKRRGYVPHLIQLVREAISETELERANARIAQGIFVGRVDELARLRAVLAAAADGQGALALLTGEPGIGKSSLATQIGRDAEAQRWLVIHGRCYEDEAPAYQPWKQLQRRLAESEAGCRGEDELDATPPELIVGIDDQTRYALFDDAAAHFRRAARRRPLLLVIEDLQWADEHSIRLLRFMAREVATARLAIVGTYREGELPAAHPLRSALPELRRERFVEMRLHGLSANEVGELVAAIAQRDVPDDFVRAIHARTEGNPFFVQEILRCLVDEGIVFHQAGQWTSEVDADEMPIPESVRAVIERRVAHLPEEARAVLAAVASVGRECAGAALAQRLDAAIVCEGVRAALRARVLSERAGVYRFSHALIHEAVREGLAPLGASARSSVAGGRDASVFRLDGRVWTIRHAGVTVHLPHVNGLGYLAHLVRNPGRHVEALELPRLAQGLPAAAESRALANQRVELASDARALREIGRAIAELDEEIEDAGNACDEGRRQRAIERRAQLDAYLHDARGLGGRLRRFADQGERARLNVTKCIRRAVDQIGESHPALAEHFRASIRTGRSCVYAPADAQAIAWTF